MSAHARPDAEPSDIQGPPIDRETLAQYRDVDEALLSDLIDAFLTEVPSRVRALDDACASGTIAVLKAEGHALKGSARVFGATTLAELCQTLELTTVVNDATRTTLASLDRELARVRVALERAREEETQQ